MSKQKRTSRKSPLCFDTMAAQCLVSRARSTSRAISAIYDEGLRPLGLRVSQMPILVSIATCGTAKQSEIGAVLLMEKSTISRNVDVLVRNGWIRAIAGEGGTRELKLTATGRKLLERATPVWQKAQKKMCSLLGEKDAAAMRRIAEKLRGAG